MKRPVFISVLLVLVWMSPAAAADFDLTQDYCARPFHTFLDAVDVAIIGTVRRHQKTVEPMGEYDYIIHDFILEPVDIIKGNPEKEIRYSVEYSSTGESAATMGEFAEGDEALVFLSRYKDRPGYFPYCSMNTDSRYYGTPALKIDIRKYIQGGGPGMIRYRGGADNFGQVEYTREGRFTGTVIDRRGNVLAQYEIVDGKADGPRRVYTVVPGVKEPRLTREEHYKAGKRHGLFRWYDKDGAISGEEEYADGKLTSSVKYDMPEQEMP